MRKRWIIEEPVRRVLVVDGPSLVHDGYYKAHTDGARDVLWVHPDGHVIGTANSMLRAKPE